MKYFLLFLYSFMICGFLHAQQRKEVSPEAMQIDARWLKKNLRRSHPRLILTASKLKDLQTQEAPLMSQHFHSLKQQADALISLPVLERKQIGRRLLGVSREALRRLSALSLVYLMEKDDRYLARIESELKAVCSFSDWNPSHFLDVAEMSTAVAFTLDWLDGNLSEEVESLARKALREKGLDPSFEQADYNWWISRDNNWNQVCHAGMLAAALVLAEEDPQLTVNVINRLIKHAPTALEVYGPDGAYPEGPSYWAYGTAYSLLMFDMLESALGTDFGLPQVQGFMESATYRLMMATPSGKLYNYADNNGQGLSLGTLELLAWFAKKSGQRHLLPTSVLADRLENTDKISRFSGFAHVWLNEWQGLPPTAEKPLPSFWQGGGANPVAVLRGRQTDPHGYYLGVKGGQGSVNHGNMDAGSFVFEWKGVMWSVDMGNQSYNELEQIMGGDLWNRAQESPRWTLLTKNNFGHSTLTVNDALHQVDGFATVQPLEQQQDTLSLTMDMSEVFEGQLGQAQRRFSQPNDHSLMVEDFFDLLASTHTLSWNMMTQASVEIRQGGAILRQGGAALSFKVLAPKGAEVSIRAMSPPPLEMDKHIPLLKRLEIRIPAYVFPNGKGNIRVLLEGI